MNAAFLALAPTFVLIGLGWAIRRAVVRDEAFWAGADRIVYFVFLPVLLFKSIAAADLKGLPVGPAFAVAGAAVLSVWLALALLKRPLGLGNAAYASVVQGSVRNNTYVALAAGFAVYGEETAGVAGLAVAAFVPLVNLVSVIVLARTGKGKTGLGRLMSLVVTNPLIIACALGVAANGQAWSSEPFLLSIVDILARTALPLGLLAVGAGLDFRALGGSGRALAVASLFKLALMPALALAALRIAGLGGTEAGVLMLFAAAPTAVAAYALARQMGGDAKLMAGIITVDTVLALATLPAWVWIVQRLG